MLKAKWQAIYFGIAILGLVFIYGVAVGNFQIFPFSIMAASLDAIRDWRENGWHYLRVRPEKQLYPARHDGQGVVTLDNSRMYPGVTFLSGLWGNSLGMLLLDEAGNEVHRWPVSFNEIFETAPHLNGKPHDWDMNLHGSMLYPNGDVVFNFEYNGMVRLDRCGNVVWRVNHQTHHQIYEDGEGNLWTSGLEVRNGPLDRLPRMPVPLEEELMLKISPNGEILKQWSLLDSFYQSELHSILFASGFDKLQHEFYNITHINDVEILEESIADQFEGLDAGDIMVSIRNQNMIAVIDPDDGRIKWWRIGPFIRQHDPDFLPDGRISVFDNNRDDNEGSLFGGSRILIIDPQSTAVEVEYIGTEEHPFYTTLMGAHQTLPNGNVLITESFAGRAFEVTPNGEIVWEYINRWDEDEVALLDQATRYPVHYKEFATEACGQ